jgi:hypothetical protein
MLDMSSKAPPAVEANPDVQADESIAIVAPATSLPAVDVKPKTPPISSPAPETTAPPTGESSKARPALLSRSQDLAEPDVTENNLPKLLSTIVAGLDPHADAAAIETTDKVIGKLTALSSAARKLAEARLLHALMLLTPVISTRLMKGRPWGLSWLMTMMSREDADRRRAALQLTFVQRLNEEFGWTQQDRRVYELVGREGGSALVSHLNAFGRALGVSKAAAEGRNAPRTLPLLDERDARAFFRDNYTSQAPLLAKVRSGDRLPARWQTGVFLTLPWWLLKTGNFGFLIIWLVAAVTAVKVIAAADEHRFASIRFLDQEIHYWPLAAVVAYLPLLALHFWAAAYAYRWDISRLRNRVAAADRRGIFDPGRRAVFIGRTLNRFLRSCGVFVLLPTLFAVFVALLGSLIAIIAGSHTVALSPNDRTPVEAVAFAAVVLVMAAYGWVKKVK